MTLSWKVWLACWQTLWLKHTCPTQPKRSSFTRNCWSSSGNSVTSTKYNIFLQILSHRQKKPCEYFTAFLFSFCRSFCSLCWRAVTSWTYWCLYCITWTTLEQTSVSVFVGPISAKVACLSAFDCNTSDEWHGSSEIKQNDCVMKNNSIHSRNESNVVTYSSIFVYVNL